MNEDLLNMIQSLYEKIEEREKAYNSAIEENKDHYTLKTIRTQITSFKMELQQLEHSLFDEFRKGI